MAETPQSVLTFAGGCPDCGAREVALPEPLPPVGDDFDWLQRDYDSFRLAMLEELAARFPERRRWSPADMEVVLVEALSVALDQLSDMLDRVHAEAFLESARRPDSVRRLLRFIGYDPLETSGLDFDPGDRVQVAAAEVALMDLWLKYPHRMAEAKVDGPRSIHRQRRMVTTQDYVGQLESHPLVERAHAELSWTGSWTTLEIACLCLENTLLDTAVADIYGAGDAQTEGLMEGIEDFHRGAGLDLPNWSATPTLRAVIGEFLDAYRMAGREVWLQDPEFVGIVVDLSVSIAANAYRSEVVRAVKRALGRGIDGFFSPPALHFGEDLHASDLVSAVMSLPGVETVCLNRFKRVGLRYADQSDSGRIVLEGIEIAVCDNDPARAERGSLRIRPHGGLAG